jgi:hypothetical protein
MKYYRRVVKRRPATLTDDEWIALGQRRARAEELLATQDVPIAPPVVIRTVLCPFCREYHSPAEVDTCMVLPRKTTETGNSTTSSSSALAAGALTQYSEIWAFLTATAYEDGSKRQTGKLSLSYGSGMLGISLQDMETGQYCFLEGRDLDQLLLDVEVRLAEGVMPWRASKWPPRAKK